MFLVCKASKTLTTASEVPTAGRFVSMCFSIGSSDAQLFAGHQLGQHVFGENPHWYLIGVHDDHATQPLFSHSFHCRAYRIARRNENRLSQSQFADRLVHDVFVKSHLTHPDRFEGSRGLGCRRGNAADNLPRSRRKKKEFAGAMERRWGRGLGGGNRLWPIRPVGFSRR